MSLPPKLPTGSARRLLDAIVASDQDEILVWVDGRKPWRLEKAGPGWRAATFVNLCKDNWITIRVGFAGGTKVALTEQARTAYRLEEAESSTPDSDDEAAYETAELRATEGIADLTRGSLRRKYNLPRAEGQDR